MKKKLLLFGAFLILSVGLVACGPRSVIQEETGATAAQGRNIEKWLASVDIACASITLSDNPLTEGMDSRWTAYDIVGENGNPYLLILRGEDRDFTAVLEPDGTLLAGLIDNDVLPTAFA